MNQKNTCAEATCPPADPASTPAHSLRQQAEAKLAARHASAGSLPPADAGRAFHELQVHQIELEMQNEELRRAQVEMDAARTRYFDLYDLVPVGYCTLSEQGLILEANLTAATLLGVPRGTMTKQPFSRFVVRESHDVYYKRTGQLFKTSAPQMFELRMLRGNAAPFWALVELTAAKDSAGAPVCRAVLLDITERRQAEDSLSESDSRFRRLLQDVEAVAVQGYGSDGTTHYWNQASERMYGYSAQEAIGRSLLELIVPPDIREYVREAIRQMCETGQPIPAAEVPLMRKDGSIVTVFSCHTLVQVPGRQPELFCLDIDLTEQKRTDTALRESEERYRNMFNRASDGILLHTADGTIRDVNESFARMHGYGVEEMRRMRLKDIDASSSGALFEAHMSRLMAGESLTFEVEHYHKDGHAFPIEVSVSLIKSGEETCLQSFHRDISERKRTEDALKDREAKFRAFFEQAGVGVAILETSTGQFANVNRRYCDIVGYTQEDMRSTTFQAITHPDDLEADLANMARLRSGEIRQYSMEKRYFQKSGRIVWVNLAVTPLWQPGQPPSFHMAVVEDITERKRAQETLVETEKKYRGIFEESVAAVYVFDSQKHFVDVNQAGLDLLGYSRDELLRLRIPDVDADPVVVLPAHQEHLSAGRLLNYEHKMRRKDGAIVTVLNNSRPLTDDKGTVVGLLSTVIDVTARKNAEDLLLERERQYQELFESSSDALVLLASETGKIIAVNKMAAVLYGYEQDELLAMKGTDLSAEPVETSLRIREAHTKPGKVFHVPLRLHRKKDGTVVPVEITARSLIWEGQSVLLVACRDITERNRAEELLRASEYFFRESQSAASVGSYSTDFVAGVWKSSEVLDGIFGIDGSYDRTVQGWLDLVHPDDREMMDRYLREEVIAKRKAFDKEYRIVRKSDGELRWVGGRGKIVIDSEGNVTSMTGTIQDITDLKNLQSQLAHAQKMESVGRLAGGVAHDFNNLLMGILSYVDLCRDELPAEHPIRPFLDEISSDAQRSADLTRQLLAFARKQTIAPKVLDLNDTVDGMLKLLRRLLGENINLTWSPGPNLWNVKLDPSQVDQILANLCVNARDAIASVGRLTIETFNITVDEPCCAGHADAVPGEYVLLSVSDTGHGMSKEVIDHIFEPFFTTKEIGKGTGLGLATVFGIVAQNKGFITVYSEPGKGTMFKIYLPRFAAQIAAPVADETSTKAPRGSGTILLVEDEKSVRVTMQKVLKKLGYTVLVAEDPDKALHLAAEHVGEIHLLITDIIMPGMSGSDLALQLCGLRPAIKRLFVSGFTADVIAQEGVLEESMPFLTKPFDRDQLAHKVREVLEGEVARSEAGEHEFA